MQLFIWAAGISCAINRTTSDGTSGKVTAVDVERRGKSYEHNIRFPIGSMCVQDKYTATEFSDGGSSRKAVTTTGDTGKNSRWLFWLGYYTGYFGAFVSEKMIIFTTLWVTKINETWNTKYFLLPSAFSHYTRIQLYSDSTCADRYTNFSMPLIYRISHERRRTSDTSGRGFIQVG